MDTIERVSVGNSISVLRIFSSEQAEPFLTQIMELTNKTLPPIYPRILMSGLKKNSHILPDGRTIDLRETWNGNTFLMFMENRLSGVSIGRRECILDREGNFVFTGRGFVPWIVVSSEMLNSPKRIFLTLPFKSLVNAGANEILGSCSPSNSSVEKMCSRLATRRWIDGDWVRYIVSQIEVERIFQLLTRSQKLDSKTLNKLVSPNP